MQINLSGHHIDVTPSLREFVNTKFTKLERHFEHINNVYVVLKLEKNQHIAESTLHLNRGEVHAKSEHTDMYAAVDLLIDKLDRQVLKHKDKLNHH